MLGETARLLSLFCDASMENLMLLDACGFSSPGLIPFSAGVLPDEMLGLVAEDEALSHAGVLSAGGLRVEDCPEPTDLLAELTDARGRGIELLFESPVL